MSSVKRRKVDDDVPSEILKKKKSKSVLKEPPQVSASPEPATKASPEPTAEEEVPAKTFKDLVCSEYCNYLPNIANNIRE